METYGMLQFRQAERFRIDSANNVADHDQVGTGIQVFRPISLP